MERVSEASPGLHKRLKVCGVGSRHEDLGFAALEISTVVESAVRSAKEAESFHEALTGADGDNGLSGSDDDKIAPQVRDTGEVRRRVKAWPANPEGESTSSNSSSDSSSSSFTTPEAKKRRTAEEDTEVAVGEAGLVEKEKGEEYEEYDDDNEFDFCVAAPSLQINANKIR